MQGLALQFTCPIRFRISAAAEYRARITSSQDLDYAKPDVDRREYYYAQTPSQLTAACHLFLCILAKVLTSKVNILRKDDRGLIR